MADTALSAESALTSAPARARKVRGEVLAGPERRRRWSVEEKLRILSQCAMPGATPSLVCREHGIGTGQLYTWRKQFRSGELTGFAPVTVTPALNQLPEPEIPVEAASPVLAPAAAGVIEVELPSGVKLRLKGDIAEPLLRRVLAAFR